MKRFACAFLCLVLFACIFAGCQPKKNPVKPTKSPVVSGSPNTSAGTSLSPSSDTNTLPPVTPTPTPKPTPKPTIRPAQKDSIVPSELLLTGYTTPLDPKSVAFPKNYNMPYYIEVDVTNQCVNIFRKNDETGAYDILLNRFVCSGGTSTKPTRTGNFYIKSEAEQKKATGQSVKYTRYYFKNYGSYAYYITRYSNEYMFHSFTFEENKTTRQILPKKASYYNMGNTGSAGCLRMLMNHAKWIYDNIDAGTYVVVNKWRAKDTKLRSVLKKYVPTLGYDMSPAWDGNRSNLTGLTRTEFIQTPDVVTTPAPVTPTPTQAPTPTVSPTPTATPTPTVAPTPTETPVSTPVVPTDEPTPTATETT